MQDQDIQSGQAIRIEGHFEGISHVGILCHTPRFMPNQAGAMRADCIRIVSIAVVPRGLLGNGHNHSLYWIAPRTDARDGNDSLPVGKNDGC